MSFLPIFVMGVLFGLAMDYEMFLVSAMREHYVISGDPREAVRRGLPRLGPRRHGGRADHDQRLHRLRPGRLHARSSRSRSVWPSGVSVDAFLVRMTLVPAVLVLLDHRAWWLPDSLQRGLPEVDVEGAALHRKIAYDDYRAAHGQTTLLAQDLVVAPGATPVHVSARGRARSATSRCRTATTRGRWPGSWPVGVTPSAGELVVDGLLVPEQREAVVRRTALLELTSPDRSEGSVEDRVHDRVRLEAMSGRRRGELTAQALGLVDELAAVATPQGADGSVASAVVEAALGLGNGVDVFVLSGLEGQPEPDRRVRRAARRGAGQAWRHRAGGRPRAGARSTPPPHGDSPPGPRRRGRPMTTTALSDHESTRSSETDGRRSPWRRILVLGVLLPLVAASLLIWSATGRQSHIDQVPVAIVNNDTIITDPQPMAAGRSLTAALTHPADAEQQPPVGADRQDDADRRAGERLVLRRADDPVGLLQRHPVHRHGHAGPGQADAGQQRGGEHDHALHQPAGRDGRGRCAGQPGDAWPTSGQVYDGFNSLAEGNQKAATSAAQLADGTKQLSDGAAQLDDGRRAAVPGPRRGRHG